MNLEEERSDLFRNGKSTIPEDGTEVVEFR